MHGTFCLTFLAAGGFAICFQSVSVGPGSHDVRHCKSVDMMSCFTSLYPKLETPKASKKQCRTALKSKPESKLVQLIPTQGRGLNFQCVSYIYLHNSECKFCISSHMGITNWEVRFLINLCPQENMIMSRTHLWWQYSHRNLLSPC